MDILRPSFRYRARLYVLLTIVGIVLLGVGIGLAWIFSADLERAVQVNHALQIFVIILLLGYSLSLWAANHYYRGLSYELSENGIIFHRGFAIPNERHINLRSIAGVTVKRDLIDRWLEIGTLEFFLVESMDSKPSYLRLVGISDTGEGYRKISSMLMNNWAEQFMQCKRTEEGRLWVIENPNSLVSSQRTLDIY